MCMKLELYEIWNSTFSFKFRLIEHGNPVLIFDSVEFISSESVSLTFVKERKTNAKFVLCLCGGQYD